MTIAEDRVAAGAALLDERIPDWFEQIDIDSLEMADECHCVLGQLGSNQVNLDRLGWEPGEFPFEDGFNKMLSALDDPAADDIGCDAEFGASGKAIVSYGELRDAWLVEIEKRRDA